MPSMPHSVPPGVPELPARRRGSPALRPRHGRPAARRRGRASAGAGEHSQLPAPSRFPRMCGCQGGRLR